jgi:hypothetical protein
VNQSFIVSGNQVKLSLQLVVKQFEAEINHLLDQAEVEALKLVQQGYSIPQAEAIVMGWIQNNQGFAKAYWTRQDKLINELENKLVALPVHEYGDQHPDELLKWVLGEVITHHCHDCLRLSKMEPMTIGEWRKLDTGLPGEGKTQCSFGCKCKLKPVKGIKPIVQMTNEEAIKDILNRTGNKTEHAYCFKGRNVILSKGGEEAEIRFSNAECNIMKNSDLLMHNHPSSSSFSFADVQHTLDMGIDEIWAIAPKSPFGNGYYYIKPVLPENVNKNEFFMSLWDEVELINKEILEKNWLKIAKGEITIETASKTHYHNVWIKIAKKYGWKYGFKERN